MKKLSIIAAAIFLAASATAQVTINLDAGRRGPKIGARHNGLFFEEINHAGDGGLYAEMIRNRSFQDNWWNPDFWWPVGDVTQAECADFPLNENNTWCNRVEMRAPYSGIRNEGWWRMNVQAGQKYRLSLWVRTDGTYNGDIVAQFQNEARGNLGQTIIKGPFDGTWKKIETEIIPTATDIWGWFALLGTEAGVLYYDCVSLMPPTYKDRPNGCRKDLAEMLAAIKPGFLRFPGGCVIEGNWVDERTNRFEWKKTIGPIEQRPGHFNANWWYQVSDGFGFDEMLQLSEDIGAEPLFVVNMGFGHGWEDPNVQPYIQEALDAIEYCNGDENTYWGRRRVENGHKEPYNLRLLEIGNENYFFGPYSGRYIQFYNAIHEKYPYIEFIGDGDGIVWGLPWPTDFVDQHYYMTPQWFRDNYHLYDNYSRSNNKVYVGEYAVTQNMGVNGNLDAALGEAVFMLGMENNSDVVQMNSYAPIFTHEDSYGWRPDMIRFNCNYSYGTPSFHVQQMMGANHGKENIKWTIGNTTNGPTKIGLSSWGASVKYDNIIIKDKNGKEIYKNDFSSDDLTDWQNDGGEWEVIDGELCQTDLSLMGGLMVLNSLELGKNYTLELDATKVDGSEGFIVAMNIFGKNDYSWWNIGGWNNTQDAVEQCVNGARVTIENTAVKDSIYTDKTYHLEIIVNGSDVQCYMDGRKIHDCSVNALPDLYLASNIDDDSNTLYIKAVNYRGSEQQVLFNIDNALFTSGDVVILTSPSLTDENNIWNPNYVAPKTQKVNPNRKSLSYALPAYSLCIFRMKVSGVKKIEEIAEELPSPIVSYSFEEDNDSSDLINGTAYKYVNIGDGDIMVMEDGNNVYYSANNGYLNLGKKMARDVLAKLTGDYSICIDILTPNPSNYDGHRWAYGINFNTTEYVGLVSAPNNNDWFYEARSATSNAGSSAASGGGIQYEVWHNIVFSQKDGVGTLYIDGYPEGTNIMAVSPKNIAGKVSTATIAKSPFSADRLMNATYFDNFKIYDIAIDGAQAKAMYEQLANKSTTAVATAIREVSLQQPSTNSQIYNLSGQNVRDSYKGIVISNGKKVLVK